MSVEGFETLDCFSESQSLTVVGKDNKDSPNSSFLVWKASRDRATEVKPEQFAESLQASRERKPNVARGSDRGQAACDKCVCHGHRKEPKGNGVGKCTFKRTGDQSSDLQIQNDISVLCGRMEKATKQAASCLPNCEDFKKLQHEFELPAFGNRGKKEREGVSVPLNSQLDSIAGRKCTLTHVASAQLFPAWIQMLTKPSTMASKCLLFVSLILQSARWLSP